MYRVWLHVPLISWSLLRGPLPKRCRQRNAVFQCRQLSLAPLSKLLRHAHITGRLHIRQGQGLSRFLLLTLKIPRFSMPGHSIAHLGSFRPSRERCDAWDESDFWYAGDFAGCGLVSKGPQAHDRLGYTTGRLASVLPSDDMLMPLPWALV